MEISEIEYLAAFYAVSDAVGLSQGRRVQCGCSLAGVFAVPEAALVGTQSGPVERVRRARLVYG